MDSSWLADRFESETNKKVRLVMHDALLSLYPDEFEEESDENDGADDDDNDDNDGDLLGFGMDDGDKKKKTSNDEMSDLFGDMSVRGGEDNEEENGGGFSFIGGDEGEQEEESGSGFDFVGAATTRMICLME